MNMFGLFIGYVIGFIVAFVFLSMVGNDREE
jgi:hypothetical protein